MFANFKPQTVQKRTVTKTVAKPANKTNGVKTSLPARPSNPNLRPNSSTSVKKRSPLPSPRPTPSRDSSRSTPTLRNAMKRKNETPIPQFSSDDGSSSDEEETEQVRKRTKMSSSLEPDSVRDIWCTDESREGKPLRLIDSSQHTEAEGKFRMRYKEDPGEVVELQYPSQCRPEKFTLMVAKESGGFNAVTEIRDTIKLVCEQYFPPDVSEKLTDDRTGWYRRLTIADQKSLEEGTPAALIAVVKEWNTFLRTSLKDGTISRHLSTRQSVPLKLLTHVLDQCANRAVSSSVHLLRQYENGTNDVYGELLPRLIHEIFSITHLTSSSILLDLGSGIGNVVIQAALETGAESWGIEKMPNPVALASQQATEFRSRCKLWGVKPGAVHLLSGDFTGHPKIPSVIQRADVVVVNNKAFTPDLNEALLLLFLDLKPGARIVSLKSFVPEKWEIKENNLEDIRNMLEVKRYEYFSESVSWTDAGGEYFVATKRPERILAFQERMNRRAGRRS